MNLIRKPEFYFLWYIQKLGVPKGEKYTSWQNVGQHAENINMRPSRSQLVAGISIRWWGVVH